MSKPIMEAILKLLQNRSSAQTLILILLESRAAFKIQGVFDKSIRLDKTPFDYILIIFLAARAW